VFGPGTVEGFGEWAGLRAPGASATFDALRPSLTAVATPVGDAWILSADEPELRRRAAPEADGTGAARLLPSGDALFLLQGRDRELLVPGPAHRSRLWPSRVWPGAVLLGGEVRGTWRRDPGPLGLGTLDGGSRHDRRRGAADHSARASATATHSSAPNSRWT
jgi:hypothetical protein